MSRTAQSARTGRRAAIAALAALLAVGVAATEAAALNASRDVCGRLDALAMPDGQVLCTHGDDAHLAPRADAPAVPDVDIPGADTPAVDIPGAIPAADIPAADTPAVDSPEVATPSVPALDAPATPSTVDDLPRPEALPRTDRSTTAEADEVDQRPRTSGAVPSLPPRCLGDGTEGIRVQVLAVEVVGSGIAPPTDADVRRWAGQAEWTFVTSAQRDGGSRNVRWATRPVEGGCELDVLRLRLSPADVDGFQQTITTLAELGHDRDDRRYLAFVADDQVCGIGTVTNDDRPGFDNEANHRVGYSRIDARCWATADAGYHSIAAHELAHNLGGVQLSAPNSNGSYHCNDEWDLLCYSEGGQSLDVRCSDDRTDTVGRGDHLDRLLDCNADDYFNAGDDVRGYLADHWNVADAQVLHGAPTPSPPSEPANRTEVAGGGGEGGGGVPGIPTVADLLDPDRTSSNGAAVVRLAQAVWQLLLDAIRR